MLNKKLPVFITILVAVSIICGIYIFKFKGNNKDTYKNISVLRISLVPDEGGDKKYKRYVAILDRFEESTGISYKYVPAKSYEDLVEKFINNEVDFAYFGGLAFLKAHKEVNAEPLVMRDIDLKFTSYFLASGNSNLKNIKDFKGKTLSFGSKLSTSGHLMPRYFMMQEGVIPETFFSKIIYSGAHDKTALLIRDGKADIGVSNSKVIDNMYSTGELKTKDVKIIKTSPPYPDYVWAVQNYLPQSLKNSLRDTFTSLLYSDEMDRPLLNNVSSKLFIKADMADFKPLEDIAYKLKLLE